VAELSEVRDGRAALAAVWQINLCTLLEQAVAHGRLRYNSPPDVQNDRLGTILNGYEADLQALEDGINKIIPPLLDTAGLMWGRLHLLDHGEPSRMSTNSGTAIGLPLTLVSGVFAKIYVETTQDLINNARDYHGALETFRDALRQVLESYRHQELRHEESFGTIRRDI
jgi:hypothetical protein